MKIDKAIEILTQTAYDHAFTTGPDFYDALKLGIEALKAWKFAREHSGMGYEAILPGEEV